MRLLAAILTLASGFSFDYTLLYGEGRVELEAVAALQERLQAAHAAVGEMRQSGVVRGHLSKDGTPEKVLFSQLPFAAEGHLNSPSSLQQLKNFGQRVKADFDAVVFFGIGGSYLGNKVIFDLTCGEFWNQKHKEARGGWPKLYFSGNNIDPRRTQALLEQVEYDAQMKAVHGDGAYKVMLVVISKSGSTLDTMACFMAALAELRGVAGVELEVVAVTDPAQGAQATLLGKLAAEEGWERFSVPDGVGGRFSIFSEVGLVTAACCGFDIDAFLAGARAMDEACRGEDVWSNPAMLNAALKYLAAQKYGRTSEVFMPYSDDMKSVAEWYVQLLAESLGKRQNREGETVYYGRTPIVAVGTTDMHAQTQQHQDGPKDKVLQFVRVGNWAEDRVIPDVFPQVPKLAAMAGVTMGQALEAARQANAEALAADGRFSAVFTLPELNAYHIGELLYLLALSVAYEGELANVDAFDQPGVEGYKRLLGPKLQELKG